MSTIWRKWAGLLALVSAFVLGVTSVAAQTATPAADAATTAAQTGGWLGLSWWVWIVIGLLLLFLLWWLFFRRRRPAPLLPPAEPPRRMTPAGPPAQPVMPDPLAYNPVPESPTRLTTPAVDTFDVVPEPSLSIVSEPDNLKRIEGIGPRIESILNSAGITTFRALSNTPVERLREILNAAELRGSFGDPTSWPEQARLAAEGMWDQLKTLQDGLKGGR